MEKRRVLVVDDSALVRKMVSLALEGDPDLEPIIAPNGALALAKIERSAPALVVLDFEMPGMDGLETLERIRALYPGLPVIVFSAQTEKGSNSTMEALARGATDCVLKPSHTQNMEEALDYVREHLLTRVRGLCHLSEKPPGGWAAVATNSHPASFAANTQPGLKPSAQIPSSGSAIPTSNPDWRPKVPPMNTQNKIIPARMPGNVQLIVIGVSTGGPNALAALVPNFPKDLGIPVLIVQHMPPMFTKLLADRLGLLCPLNCREASNGEEVGPGDLRLAPGNFHMTVARKEGRFLLHLNQESLENSCRPAVDVLFRHAAACAQNHVLAVILTGMGQDGLRGSEAVKAEGGVLLAQDEATSVVWGMPGAVANAGITDCILPLQEIGPEIMRRVRTGKY